MEVSEESQAWKSQCMLQRKVRLEEGDKAVAAASKAGLYVRWDLHLKESATGKAEGAGYI
eukprot:scaffold160962_cov19-Tisochrysis_lutea.AAC.1